MNECLTTPQHEKQISYWVSERGKRMRIKYEAYLPGLRRERFADHVLQGEHHGKHGVLQQLVYLETVLQQQVRNGDSREWTKERTNEWMNE